MLHILTYNMLEVRIKNKKDLCVSKPYDCVKKTQLLITDFSMHIQLKIMFMCGKLGILLH